MNLRISSELEQFEIEITGSSGRRRVRVGESEVACDWIRVADGQYSLILDGSVYDLFVDLDTDTCSVAGRRATHQFRISDPQRLGGGESIEEGQAGLQRICAEMPGKVVRLLVKPGDAVSYDQSLLVLEAMKMQNEIRAPKSGVIKEVGVQDGRAVSTGDFLLSLE